MIFKLLVLVVLPVSETKHFFVSVSLRAWSEETVCPDSILPRKKEPKPSICRVVQVHLNSFIWHYHIFVAN